MPETDNQQRSAPTSPLAPLTRRETQVARLISEGKSVKQTAQILGVSFKTAETHKYNLYKKLQVHKSVELALIVFRSSEKGKRIGRRS